MIKFQLFVFAFLIFACNSNNDKLRIHLNKAQAYFDVKNFVASAKEINMALKIDSLNPDVNFLNAQYNTEVKSYDKSIYILKSLVRLKYKVDTCYTFIANNYLAIGSFLEIQKDDSISANSAYLKSFSYFDSALSKNDRYFQAYIGKIKVLHNSSRHDDAILMTNNCLLIFPDSSLLIMYRGIEKHYLGDNEGAFFDLTKFITTNKFDSLDLATAYRFRSVIYSSRDSLNKAISDVTTAILYNPHNESLYAERGYLYQSKNEKSKACNDFRKAADLGYTSLYSEISTYCK